MHEPSPKNSFVGDKNIPSIRGGKGVCKICEYN